MALGFGEPFLAAYEKGYLVLVLEKRRDEGTTMTMKRERTDSRCDQVIRILREGANLSQQEVADYLGTSQTMYARYERAANILPTRHLIALARMYHVPVGAVLGLEPIPEEFGRGRAQGEASELGERIREIREAYRETEETFGEKTGVPAAVVRDWESGLLEPDLGMVSRICDLYGVSADYLLGLSEKRELDQEGDERYRGLSGAKRDLLLAVQRVLREK